MSSSSLRRSSSQKRFFQKAENKLKKIFTKYSESERKKFGRNAKKIFRSYDEKQREYVSTKKFSKGLTKLKLILDEDLVESICSQFDFKSGVFRSCSIFHPPRHFSKWYRRLWGRCLFHNLIFKPSMQCIFNATGQVYRVYNFSGLRLLNISVTPSMYLYIYYILIEG